MSDPVPSPARPGCLTEQEVAQVRGAAGQVPEGLARHLASCERCQERALFGALRPARKRRDGPVVMPTPTRALILLGVMVAVIVAFFITLQQLVGGR